MDTAAEKAYLPERRIQKGAALLTEEGFDYGSKGLTLKQLQRFRGIMTGWASAVRGLATELRAADKFLGGLDGGAYVKPKIRGEGSEAWEREKAWEDLWELFEVCRWLSSRSEMWDTMFAANMKDMLPPMERISLPGEWEGAVFVSSDATPSVK